VRWASFVALAPSMGGWSSGPLAHRCFGRSLIAGGIGETIDSALVRCGAGGFLWERGFLVCSSATNVLIRNGLLYARFATKLSRINVLLQTTNLGVSGSNPFGRANLTKGLMVISLG
jgi:hypothetical protein